MRIGWECDGKEWPSSAYAKKRMGGRSVVQRREGPCDSMRAPTAVLYPDALRNLASPISSRSHVFMKRNHFIRLALQAAEGSAVA